MAEFTYLELDITLPTPDRPLVPDPRPATPDDGRRPTCMLEVLHGLGWEVVSDSAPTDHRQIVLRKAI